MSNMNHDEYIYLWHLDRSKWSVFGTLVRDIKIPSLTEKELENLLFGGSEGTDQHVEQLKNKEDILIANQNI